MHLTRWTNAYGEELKPKWLHLFYHTLDVIPRNWYIETKLRHGTSEWDILHEGFLKTFMFQDEWMDIVDDALKAVKAAIFRNPREPEEVAQMEWAQQLSQALQCYNVQVEDDDPMNINILEIEGSHEVRGPAIEDPNITVRLKTKQVNIGTEEELKYPTLGDYWDAATVEKVVELLKEYQDLFPTKMTELKGILDDLGMMKITLKPDAKLVKKQPYQLNPKYKANVREELDKMLVARIIEPVEESEWVSPIVVQEKK